MADRREGNIKNYDGPRILLGSLSFHGDFGPGGEMGGGGRKFLGFGSTRWCLARWLMAINLPLNMGPYADRNGCHL